MLIQNKAETKVTYDGSAGVKAILVNCDHEGYLKYVIDDSSLSFLQQNINNITAVDPAQAAITRMTTWFYMN